VAIGGNLPILRSRCIHGHLGLEGDGTQVTKQKHPPKGCLHCGNDDTGWKREREGGGGEREKVWLVDD
jgi:hypothetical protein